MLHVLVVAALAATPTQTETSFDPLIQLPQLNVRLGGPAARWGISLPWGWHVQSWMAMLEPAVVWSTNGGAFQDPTFTVRAGARRIWQRSTFEEGLGLGLNAWRGYFAVSPEAFIRFGNPPGRWVIAIRYEYAIDAPPEWVFGVQLTYW